MIRMIRRQIPLLRGWLMRRHTSPMLGHWGAIVGLLLLVLVFSIFSVPFRQVGNLVLLSRNAAITIGIVAVGQTIILVSGGIDLSVGAVIAISALVSASLMKYGLGPIPPLTGNWCYVAIGI